MEEGLECYKTIDQTNQLESFVKKYSPLVHKVVGYIYKNIPEFIEYDDLLQSGLIGLLEAKNTFDDKAGVLFSTYAIMKIRYAIYAYIRKASGITREISQNIKKIAQAAEALGVNSTDQNMAQKLGVSVQQYFKMVAQINAYKSLSSYDFQADLQLACDNQDDPLKHLELDNFKKVIKEALLTLPKREQTILALHYHEQLKLKQIADILGLTEARISQLHHQSLDKLKERVRGLLPIQD